MANKTFYATQVSNCDRRRLDLERTKRYLTKHNVIEVQDVNLADYIVAMTCSTTDANIADSINLLNQLYQNSNPHSQLIIGGCLDKSEMPKLPKDRLLVQFNPKDGFLPLQNAFGYKDSPYELSDVIIPTPNILNVRVQDGCFGACSYCDIRDKIGRSRSRNESKIIRDIEETITSEIQYIRLTGDDVGTYGFQHNTSLVHLIEKVSKNFSKQKVIIDNLDPKYLVSQWDGLRIQAENKRIFHMKIPVQHFDERILKIMRRYSDTKRVSEIINQLGSNDIHLQTHFIVGFPTESKEDLMVAVNKVLALPFGQIAFIPYANKVGTPASQLCQIDKSELKDRMEMIKVEAKKRGKIELPYIDELGIPEIKIIKEGYQNGYK